MKIAIINCKSKKQKYQCTAEEMYSASALFRAQLEFINKFYDGYLILSSKHGILHPTTIIEPYDTNIRNFSKEEKTEWSKNVLDDPIWNSSPRGDSPYEFHLHISLPYWTPIKEYFSKQPNCTRAGEFTHVVQPVNLGLSIKRYQEAIDSGILDLAALSARIPSTNPEAPRWYYHNNHDKFYGLGYHLKKQYPILDDAALWNLAVGNTIHTRGWVTSEANLNKIYFHEKRQQWRIK